MALGTPAIFVLVIFRGRRRLLWGASRLCSVLIGLTVGRAFPLAAANPSWRFRLLLVSQPAPRANRTAATPPTQRRLSLIAICGVKNG